MRYGLLPLLVAAFVLTPREPAPAEDAGAGGGRPVRLVVQESYERLEGDGSPGAGDLLRSLTALAGRTLAEGAGLRAADRMELTIRGEVVSLRRAWHGDLEETRLFVQVRTTGRITATTSDGVRTEELEAGSYVHYPEDVSDRAGLEGAYRDAVHDLDLPALVGAMLLPEGAARVRFLARALLAFDDTSLRRSALLGLEHAVDAAPALAALRQVLAGEPRLAGAVAKLIAGIGGEEAVACLLDRFGATRGEERDEILRGLARLRRPDVARAVVGAYLDGASSYALDRVATELARLAMPMLHAASHAEAGARRARAAHLLGATYAPEAVEVLLTLSSDASSYVRWNATRSLGDLDDERAIARLQEIVREDADVRCAALLALGRLEAWEALDELLDALGGEDPRARDFAAQGLTALTGETLGEDAAAWRAWRERHHPRPAWWRVGRSRSSALPARPPEVVVVPIPGSGVVVEMVCMLPGRFRMGGGASRLWRGTTPAHPVVLTRRYAIGRTEVTQAQYEAVIGTNPSRIRGPSHPVESVTWLEALRFCVELSKRTGRSFRLPTEAEWEHACRGGTQTPLFYVGERQGRYAWFRANAGGSPHPVGGRSPNPYGLCDMYGNVAEWCLDCADEYESVEAVDPRGATDGPLRGVRGGSYVHGKVLSSDHESERFDRAEPHIGFRLLLELD